MRDGQVFAMQEANVRRSALLFSQWEFLETRQRSFENALKASRLFDRVLWFFSPKAFFEVVDAVQFRILEDGKRRAEAAQEKAKEEARKPRLTIVGANGHV